MQQGLFKKTKITLMENMYEIQVSEKPCKKEIGSEKH